MMEADSLIQEYTQTMRKKHESITLKVTNRTKSNVHFWQYKRVLNQSNFSGLSKESIALKIVTSKKVNTFRGTLH
jgi:hypothetical protein